MTLYFLLPLSLLAFLLFHYVITPRIKKSESRKRWIAKIGKPGLLAILKYVDAFFFIATLTYALLILVTYIAGLSGATTAAGFETTIARIQGYRDWLKVFKSYWVLAIFALLFIAFTVFLYRLLKKAVQAEFERERLRIVTEGGLRETLEPTAEMTEVAEKIYAAQVLFDRLDPSELPGNQAAQDAQRELKEKIQKLRAKWHDLDIERRADRNLEARQEQSGSKSRTFFGSKGFLGTMKGTSRVMVYAGLVLLLLSLVGVNTALVDHALAQRQVGLTDLQVKANQKEAKESFARLLAEEEDDDGKEARLTEEDEEALRQLARHFEQAFTDAHVWDTPYIYVGDAARIRRNLVKDKIIIVHVRTPPDGPDSPTDDDGGGGGPNDSGPRDPGPKPDGPTDGGDGGAENSSSKRSERREVGVGKRPPDISGEIGKSNPPDPQKPGGTDARKRIPTTREKRPKQNPPVTSEADVQPASDDIRGRLASDKWPQTGIGERFLSDARQVVTRKKRFLGRLKDSLAAHARELSKQDATLEFRKWAAGELMGVMVDSVWPNTGELTEPVKGTFKAGLKDTARRFPEAGPDGQELKEAAQHFYDLSFEQYMTDLGEGMSLKQAEERIKSRPLATLEDMMKLRVVSEELLSSEVYKNLEKSLKDNPGTMPEPPKDVAEAKAAAAKLEATLDLVGKSSLKPEEYTKIFDQTDTYENHYPGRLDALGKTAKEMFLAKTFRPPDPKAAAALYAQARDFSQLKLSTDVGGVLIGRVPDKVAQDIDFRDLGWTISGDKVTLRLTRADGSHMTLGPFSKDVVNSALVYVADDRKVVVTIQSVYSEDKKIWRRRVLLHPALVDTALGNDIIAFDELVFKFIDGDPQREAAQERTSSQRLLYKLAWLKRRLAIYPLLEGQADAARLATINYWTQRDTEAIKALLERPKDVAAIHLGLRDAKKLSDPKTSLLMKYPAHFDLQFIKSMVACGESSLGSVENFGACVQAQAQSSIRGGLPKEVWNKWLSNPVSTSPRSIAEERPFSVDANLSFVAPGDAVGAEPAQQLWPFEFRYEIAFPVRSEAEKQNVYRWPWEEPEAYRTPWEYLELRPLIAEKVAQGVQSDASLRDLFQRVRDFAVLQRLFRISLEGELGKLFPFEKLVELTRATEGHKRREATPRWQNKPLPEG